MADVRNYEYALLTDKIVNPEESFLNFYVNECFGSENTIKPTQQIRRILDAKYKKEDINKVMTKKYQHLSTKEQEILLVLLLKFEDMFDGTLGMRNTTLVDLELRNDMKSVCLRLYPVPRVHRAMIIKEFKILFRLGVFDHAYESEWGAPYSPQPKAKNNWVNFLSDYQNLNRKLK